MKKTARDYQTEFSNSTPAMEKAILGLFSRQTQDEQAAHEDIVKNGRGFCLCDVKAFTTIAKLIVAGNPLTPKQVAYLLASPTGRTDRGRLSRYARQLNELS